MGKVSKRTEGKVWKRILEFKEGDKVRIVSASQYLEEEAKRYFIGRKGKVIRSLYRGKLLVVQIDGTKKAFVGIPDDLEYLEE